MNNSQRYAEPQCTEDGLRYGPLALVARSRYARYEVNPASAILAKSRFAIRPSGLQAVANALNEGNMARALIATVHLRLPPLDRRDARKLAKYNFDPNQPRDDHGRWTDEGDEVGASLDDSVVPDSDSTQTLKPTLAQALETMPFPGTTPELDFPDTVTPPGTLIDPIPGTILPYNFPDELTDEEKKACDEEWADAQLKCKKLQSDGILKILIVALDARSRNASVGWLVPVAAAILLILDLKHNLYLSR